MFSQLGQTHNIRFDIDIHVYGKVLRFDECHHDTWSRQCIGYIAIDDKKNAYDTFMR